MKISKILILFILATMGLSACGGHTDTKDKDSIKKTKRTQSKVKKDMQDKIINVGQIVIDNIMTRTSIRQFTDQQISKDTLDVLVKAGMAAPSAMNKQPWAFVVVTDKTILDGLNKKHPYANLKTATAAIIVCGDMKKTIEGDGKEYWVQDCSAATENILLAAHALGLGAVWCGVYPVAERIKDVSEVLSLPDYIIPLNLITLGYPNQDPQPKDKFNSDNVHYQTW